MKIQNAFRLGLFGGLGVIVAIGIGAAIGSLATILTYVGAALFIALGLDPIVSFLEKRTWPRWLAILAVLVGVLGAFTAFILAIVPVVVDQVTRLVDRVQALVLIPDQIWIDLQDTFPWINMDTVRLQVEDFVAGLDFASIGGGVLQAGIATVSAIFGAIIVLILTLYFIASLSNIKRSLYQLIPASRRTNFVDIAEQISASVGRYVMGQGSLALVNGILSFIFLTFVFRVEYSALLAFIALIGSLIPLVGTLSAAVVITLSVFVFQGGFTPAVIAVAVYYLVYMQVEAYVIAPRIMSQAVKVPGVVVVIAALAGGTLLGVLGALVAIPVAASILIIMRQVIMPRQNAH